MKRTTRRIVIGGIGCLGVCLLALGCGERGDDGTLAINLATGEIQTIIGELPEGFAPCPDPTCTIPPTIPCEALGPKVCTLHPACRLKELWCMGGGTVTPGGTGGSSDGGVAPGGGGTSWQKCEYACIPKLPLLCEELAQQKQCTARQDCEWTQGPCPMMPCTPNGVCPPCPSSCKQKPVVTGCQSDLDCAKGKFCEFKQGCGALGPGACKIKPQACPQIWAPVCGCDNTTYGSACEARAAGVSVAHVGACFTPPPPPPVGCTGNADCAKSSFCFFKSGCGQLQPGSCVKRPQACPMYYGPVCGCDGKTYDNDCLAHSAGVNVAKQGDRTTPPPPPPPPSICTKLVQDYQTALKQAKACNPLSMSPVLQCIQAVATDLPCAICTTFVNDTTALDAVKKQWTAAGCDQQLWACPAMACQLPLSGACVAGATGSAGTCQDVYK